MKYSFPSLLFLLLLFTNACQVDPQVQRAKLMEDFGKIADNETGLINEEAAAAYLSDAISLADANPSDTLAALPLYRAAEVARALGNPGQAIELYQRVIRDYGSFSKAAEAQFMLAFSYDEDMNDFDTAEQEYERFIKNYPDHGFADDAEMLLQNLGKSDEEILRELEAAAARADSLEAAVSGE